MPLSNLIRLYCMYFDELGKLYREAIALQVEGLLSREHQRVLLQAHVQLKRVRGHIDQRMALERAQRDAVASCWAFWNTLTAPFRSDIFGVGILKRYQASSELHDWQCRAISDMAEKSGRAVIVRMAYQGKSVLVMKMGGDSGKRH